MKLRNLLFILTIALMVFSCKKDDNSSSFDAEAQAEIDDALLIEYLQSHYLNEEDGGIWTITNGESPLLDDDRLAVQDIEENDISYKLYYLKQFEGVEGEPPSRADSVLTTYTGMLLDSTVFDSRSTSIWFSLTGLIEGWSYGFTNFKGGKQIINDDESFYYENSGKGILFLPSGLAYGNIGQSFIPSNAPLVFQFTLNAVNKSDHDNDMVLSIDEDIDGDGNVKNDDTDGDGIMDYLDVDDDGDGILTKDELGDENNDEVLDYLDPNY